MNKLVKKYPANNITRTVWTGDLKTVKKDLDLIESRLLREQLKGSNTEFVRIDDLNLHTCIFKNKGSENEQKMFINYSIE